MKSIYNRIFLYEMLLPTPTSNRNVSVKATVHYGELSIEPEIKLGVNLEMILTKHLKSF